MVREKFGWKGENFNRVEKIYSNGKEKVFVTARVMCTGAVQTDSAADFSNCDSSLSGQEEEACAHGGPGPQDEPCDPGSLCQTQEIISRDTPDRNKQKTSVITKIRKTTVKNNQDPDTLLTSIGYVLVSTNSVEVHRYYKNGYIIELSRFVRDGSPDAEARPAELYEYFLAKVFIEIEDGLAEEAILNCTFRDLEDDVRLVKPPLSWF